MLKASLNYTQNKALSQKEEVGKITYLGDLSSILRTLAHKQGMLVANTCNCNVGEADKWVPNSKLADLVPNQ